MDILSHFRVITDFKPGVDFYDISTLLLNPAAVREVVGQLHLRLEAYEPDLIVGIESRGFLLGTQLALDLGCPFAMARKPGKLPGKTISRSYELEYGTDSIEVQPDLLSNFKRVIVVDDLLATGGTMQAAIELVREAGPDVVAAAVIIELEGLSGRSKINPPLEALVAA